MKQYYEGNINRLYLLKQNGQYVQQTKVVEENIQLYRNFFGCWVRENGDVPTKKEEALDRAYDIATKNPDIPEDELIGGYSYLDEESIKPINVTNEKIMKKKI